MKNRKPLQTSPPFTVCGGCGARSKREGKCEDGSSTDDVRATGGRRLIELVKE